MTRRPFRPAPVALLATLAAHRRGLRPLDGRAPDLAFVSTRDGDYAVYEMNADGEGQNRLTEAETTDAASSRERVLPGRAGLVPGRYPDRVREPAQPVPSTCM